MGSSLSGSSEGRGTLNKDPVPVAGDALDVQGLTFIWLGDFEPLAGEADPPMRFWKYDPEVDELPPQMRRPRR